VLLVGGTSAQAQDDEPFTTVPLDALPLPSPRRFCFRYTILELNTAVKPWMFEYLFARGYSQVVYLDPDIVVYSPLVEIESAPPETFLMLTPHLTGSIEGDDHPSERAILQSGSYNLGFLAVFRQPSLAAFLEWWQEKLEFQCVVEIERGLFVDQKWMDLAPGLFPGVVVLRHDGYNVAYWNLRQRAVVKDGDAIVVNGQPLRFFHFSGVDTVFSDMVSKHDGTLRLADVGYARVLIERYSAALAAGGHESFKNAPYPFGTFADGSVLPDIARITYRQSIDLQAACGDDPFQHAERFRGMHDVTRSPLAAKLGVKSYRMLSSARPLVRLIPRPIRTALRETLLGHRTPTPQALRRTTARPPGLNVVGYPGRDTGVGESARLCQRACEHGGLSSALIDVESTDALARQAIYRHSVYHVNADQLPTIHGELPDLFASSSYNIGCWHWELPELPDAWIASAEALDEIWAPSAFIQRTLSRKLTIPVVHMPHGIEVTEIETFPPQALGVPEGHFTFLCLFDLDSVMERKNPAAAIDAFRRAFPGHSSHALLIKAGNADRHPEQYAELVEQVRAVPNVYLTDRRLSRAQVNGLIAACDGILSLHRSEGFGLVLAEAMFLGKPVVATGWSGNMDFMDSMNSCPVHYELVTLARTHQQYPAGGEWAEPDVDHAAHLIQRIAGDAVYRAQIGERARHTIQSRFSPEAAGLRYRLRLKLLN
jgi:glycosyltransferase involved in cell wall biosynthesis